MAPKHGNADKLMIEAAKELLRKRGCAGLRVRDVVDKAHVNLGMFHYHFKNKQRFAKVVLQEFYEEFFGRLTLAVQEGKDPMAQLKNALVAMATFVSEENEFYLAIFRDILAGDKQVLHFLQMNLPRHIMVLHELIKKCQDEGKIAQLPFPQIISFLMTSINLPILMGNACMKRSKDPSDFKDFNCVISDKGIRQRIDLALKGLQP